MWIFKIIFRSREGNKRICVQTEKQTGRKLRENFLENIYLIWECFISNKSLRKGSEKNFYRYPLGKIGKLI